MQESQVYESIEDKLERLYAEMEARDIGCLLVPYGDRFRSEFIQTSDNYLMWLTGFSGSAGVAVVLAYGKCALFVDGRYTLQAAKEVEEKNSITVFDSTEMSVYSWITKNFTPKSGAVSVFVDAWLYSCREAKRITEKMLVHKIPVTISEDNPIDAVWTRNRKPINSIRPYPYQYAGEKAFNKIRMILDILATEQANAMIIMDPQSVCWLLNIRGSDIPYTPVALCYAVVYSDGKIDLFSDAGDSLDILEQETELSDDELRIIPIELFENIIKSNFSYEDKVVIDPCTTAVYTRIMLERQQVEIIYRDDPCVAKGRVLKNDIEIKQALQIHKIDSVAVCSFLANLPAMIQERITESYLAEKLSHYRQVTSDRLAEGRFIGESFPAIVAFKRNGAVIHYRPIKGDDMEVVGDGLLLLDSGGQYLGGTTDITRTIAIGNVSAEYRKIYTLVLKGLIRVASLRFPEGRKGMSIVMDGLARIALWEHNLDYSHSTGHGVGNCLSVHERGPIISSSVSLNSGTISDGMIFSCEPGYYRAEEFGIRLENLLLTRSSSDTNARTCFFETLSLVPFDLTLIDTEFLTEQEVDWLNKYHLLVKQELSPLMPDEHGCIWLNNACKPIK